MPLSVFMNEIETKRINKTRQLQLQATVKRFLFDLHLDLEGQHTLTSLWFQRQVT